MAQKSAFQKRLDAKMRAKRGGTPLNKTSAPAPVTPSAEELEAAGYLHPSRYPEHPVITKGQVHGGICNRTACDRGNATFWNIYTHGFYCRSCGPSLNTRDSAICAPVDEKPSAEEMNDREFHATMRAEAQKWIMTRGYI